MRNYTMPANELRIGDIARSTHPYAFRSGQLYRVKAIKIDPKYNRKCVYIEFADGVTDYFPLCDIKNYGVEIFFSPRTSLSSESI